MALALLAAMAILAGGVQRAGAHALQPGFLELSALGGDVWEAFWKVPAVSGRPMDIVAVLPENCDERRPPAPRFDGSAFLSRWAATCPGGLEGGEIVIEGLEATVTDVLVRYELAAGKAESRRLSAAEPGFRVPAPQGRLGVLTTYVVLGVDHILGGVDHLLFVFALLLLIRDWRRLLGAVTAFTVAHSFSLAAASLGWIVVPTPPVEAVIALSIMFLAAELAASSDDGARLIERAPWAVAFAFGLLHGLGFARALLDIGLPEGEVPLALFAFNLGVEAGQLVFIALVLVVGALLARIYPRLVAAARTPGGHGMLTASYSIGGISAYWLVVRVAGF